MVDAEADAGEEACTELPSSAASLHELSEKVVQLTKAVVFLYTRSDGHEVRRTLSEAAAEEELKQLTAAVAKKLECHRQHAAKASSRLNGRVEEMERRYASQVREARQTVDGLRAATQKRHEAAEAAAAARATHRASQATSLRRTAEELRNRLSAAEGRATCDEQWLIRQIAAETHRERRELEKRFEEDGRQMKAQHAELMEYAWCASPVRQLRGEKDDRVQELRTELSERRRAAELEADEALAEAVQRQEMSFEAERQNLENAAERNGAALVEAREESARAKDQCEERQRVLDEMSRELQERKRQGQTLSKEADVAHQRKLRHENDGRELRRKKDCRSGVRLRTIIIVAVSVTTRITSILVHITSKDPFKQPLPNAKALLERGLKSVKLRRYTVEFQEHSRKESLGAQ
ncbi:unnamed protein product [Symbiodinium sp. CCMP2592]|nr:unnamed protein product [Symbiodinium sp. CCMP2592]